MAKSCCSGSAPAGCCSSNAPSETSAASACCSGETAVGATYPTVYPTTAVLTAANHLDHVAARIGLRRNHHRVAPGLYALGQPTENSPVFVSANYTLSFDALRSSLEDRDAYILVLDTAGINVWCAAGKGTFGTDELVRRIAATRVAEVVRHHRLILPQLGAPGVAAHEVKKRTGFTVEYGPVRAEDLPAYLDQGSATPAMRRVRFDLVDRLTLIPIELVYVFLPTAVVALILYFACGLQTALAAVAATLAGVVLFPILLPWLPTRDFTSKGLILGGLVGLPFAVMTFLGDAALWLRIAMTLVMLLALPPVTAYLALNFTGSTTFTSRTGVKREIAVYIPILAGLFGSGVLLLIVTTILRWLGVA